MVMVHQVIKIVHYVMMYLIQYVVLMVLHIKIYVNLENVLEFNLQISDLVVFLIIEDQEIKINVNVLSNLILFVVLIL